MNNDINSQIQDIINRRSSKVHTIVNQQKQWEAIRENIKRLRKDVFEINNLSTQAISANPDDTETINKLNERLAQLNIQQLFEDLESSCEQSLLEIDKLMDRFDRKTINIAVAGVGRSGKSTALKSILGIDLTDNNIIPSGSGPAVTAGKSSIHSVSQKDEEHTEIFFHTEESFLEDLIQPCLKSVADDKIQCSQFSDIELLDFGSLDRFVDSSSKTGSETRRSQLRTLKRIIDSFPTIKTLIGHAPKTIPINQTSQYVSYQSTHGMPDVCFAVKETHIYAKFPNYSINSLQLIDLPGLGTSSHIEKKCFLDGFSYSVDMALMLRRPEGISQNFPGELDLNVINVLADVYGEKHLHEVTFLFQNDKNLPADGAEKSYKEVESWNAQRSNPVEVVRGDACSAQFMQTVLLPKVLDFLRLKLPQFDENLIKDANDIFKKNETQYQQILSNIASAVKSFRSIGNEGDINKIHDFAEEIRVKLSKGIDDLSKKYTDQSNEIYNVMTESIDNLTMEIDQELESRYSPSNMVEIQKARDSIRIDRTPIKYAVDNYHSIRIQITEKYSALENIHDQLIDEMKTDVYHFFAEVFKNLFPADGTLLTVYEWFRDANLSSLADAVYNLVSLNAPFYNIIYPDIENNVFMTKYDKDKKDKGPLQEFENAIGKIPKGDNQAMHVLQALQNTGSKWVGQIEDILFSQMKIADIISDALIRFEDRLSRSSETESEFRTLVQKNFGAITGSDNALLKEIETRIINIYTICTKL